MKYYLALNRSCHLILHLVNLLTIICRVLMILLGIVIMYTYKLKKIWKSLLKPWWNKVIKRGNPSTFSLEILYISAAMRCSFHHYPTGNLLQDISDLLRLKSASLLLTDYACLRTSKCIRFSIHLSSSQLFPMSTSTKTPCQHLSTLLLIHLNTRWRRFFAIASIAVEETNWSTWFAGRTMTIVKTPGNQERIWRTLLRL